MTYLITKDQQILTLVLWRCLRLRDLDLEASLWCEFRHLDTLRDFLEQCNVATALQPVVVGVKICSRNNIFEVNVLIDIKEADQSHEVVEHARKTSHCLCQILKETGRASGQTRKVDQWR